MKDEYPYYTSYQYAGNKPVTFIDLDGLEEIEPPLTKQDQTNRYSSQKHLILFEQDQKKKAQEKEDFEDLFKSSNNRDSYNSTIGPAKTKESEAANKVTRRVLYEKKIQENRQTLNKISPFVGGSSSGNPIGFASTTATAIKQSPGVLLPELAIARIGRFISPIRNAVKASKSLQDAKSSALVGGDALSVGSKTAVGVSEATVTGTIGRLGARDIFISAEETAFIKAFVSNNVPANYGIFIQRPLSTNALRELSAQLGGKEVAQIFIKNGDTGYYNILYGSPGKIVIPKFGTGDVPYLINHVHPSGNPIPSASDVSLLKDLQKIQRSAGYPVQNSSQIVPKGGPNSKFNINSETYGF
ncbi:MAG: hypothetical protein WBA74_13910 [Cyclobacteriaceae bacterium]